MVVDRPPKKLKKSNSSQKFELLSQLLVTTPIVNPTSPDLMESLEDENLSQSSVLSPFVKPMNDDLIDELCLFINMVDDVASLEYVTFFHVSSFSC